MEVNPYISASGRRETEVKNVLAKIPSDLITMDPCSIAQVSKKLSYILKDTLAVILNFSIFPHCRDNAN